MSGSVACMSDYDTDFYSWTQRQGGLLRRLAAGERVNDADLDWPNIAEEIETLGRSERGSLKNQLATIISTSSSWRPLPHGNHARDGGSPSEEAD